ncbi:serine/threonine protein kinase [Beutenbergia cavernae DSM 12333]|uniref:non-specific serine/threonine protein kinase n=1 Tax=Beutenbergia cavernae (strain ATCC BAA-8 / DSM 12333 / CCUG 43141 / JCM 11478 / NBRC 16432 / NCIMB 13614 / HKI 0122) TaxID=471853 RepID=C5BUR9_BEUC1|nr:serine/threonine protein kinase [Beutenbergia cavernae DSM 12333]
MLLGGRYELRERIAMGGMGEVWSAVDTHLGRQVAAKVLREEFAGDEMFLERLRTEARNSANLAHPNIAMLHDYGEVDGVGYLVMELVAGEPLSDLLERRRTLPPDQLLPILAQTARALQVAHAAGVVHRDVKPSNLLITADSRVKITDFGISLGANQAPMTAAGMVMGTAQYLPPEQAMGRAATPAGDIYALGIIAYEALAGQRPFTGTTQVDIAFAHVSEPVPPLPQFVHAELRELVMSMLEKEPGRRPASAAELAVRLDEIAAAIGAEEWNPDAVQGRWRPTAADRRRQRELPADGEAPGSDGAGADAAAASPRAAGAGTGAEAQTRRARRGRPPAHDVPAAAAAAGTTAPGPLGRATARSAHRAGPRRGRAASEPQLPAWLAEPLGRVVAWFRRISWPDWTENRWLLAGAVIAVVAVLTLLVLAIGTLGTPTSLGSGATGVRPIGGVAAEEAHGAELAADAVGGSRVEGL